MKSKFKSEVKQRNYPQLSIKEKWIDIKDSRIVMIGHGGIGGCMLSLIRRHIKMNHPEQFIIIEMDKSKIPPKNKQLNAVFFHLKITKENYNQVLSKLLRKGDLLLDLAWYIDTLSLVTLCHKIGALFVNAAVEEWEVKQETPNKDLREYTLYARQMKMQQVAKEWKHQGPTAILTQGMNPGTVSVLTKIALREWVSWIEKNHPKDKKLPKMKACLEAIKENKNDRNLVKQLWARLAALINVQVIQSTERDTLVSNIPREKNVFICTWSPAGLAEEILAPVEIGVGTHETIKEDVHRYTTGERNEICFSKRGINMKAESYTPLNGNFSGFIIRHEENYSISSYFTDYDKNGNPVYRPTIYYCYQPMDHCISSLHELQSNGYKYPEKDRIPRDDIISGTDEVGVFCFSPEYGQWWTGTIQDIHTSRKLLPHQSCTLLVVAGSVLAGIVYAFRHPNLGIIHPEETDDLEMLELISLYTQPLVSGHISGWGPKIQSEFNSNKKNIISKDWILEKFLL